MLGCLAVEAAYLPRPRSQPLPNSLRNPPLHASLRALCLGTQSCQLTAPHAPASHLGHSPSQPTCQMACQGEHLGEKRGSWGGASLERKPFLLLQGYLDLASKRGHGWGSERGQEPSGGKYLGPFQETRYKKKKKKPPCTPHLSLHMPTFFCLVSPPARKPT